jgi:hypothetical protein
VCRGRPMMSTASGQSPLSHQTCYPFARAGDPLSLQFGMNPWTPLHLPSSVVGFLNAICELAIYPLMLTHRTLPPGIVPAQRDTKRVDIRPLTG